METGKFQADCEFCECVTTFEWQECEPTDITQWAECQSCELGQGYFGPGATFSPTV